MNFLSLLLLIIFLGHSVYIVTRIKKKVLRRDIIVSITLLVSTIGTFLTKSIIFVQLYPIIINLVMFSIFFSSLFKEEPIIYRFATMTQPIIRKSIIRNKVKKYCRKVTILWCCFFIFNGTMSIILSIFASKKTWAIYTGLISYILMGVLFAGEFIVRKIVQKTMEKEVPLSQLTESARSATAVLCYQGNWSQGIYKTWQDFILETAQMRAYINKSSHDTWILHCQDTWFFLICYVALLQCKKTLILTANVAPRFLQEIRKNQEPLLTDMSLPDSIFIEEILNLEWTGSPKEITPPAINPDETSIILYTSGSTGEPKAVHQRLTEFEQDNKFILSQWGPELIKRKLCTTVSHHHIYGLLFSIMLPFTAGIPFRRTRIEHPEEFINLKDDSYTIIAVPAFLKRANEDGQQYKLNNPWIFTSGGLLLPEEAERTFYNFGFWPLEVYGSTETSGIAWRFSKDGLEWTPFQNAEITLAENGCIKVRSPYIKEPAGFVTGDLAEILEDGRFILKGRSDSIVKIEEKRISTTEIENRLIQSGMVQEVVVIPLQKQQRQIMAAVVVLNKAGEGQFKEAEKLEINNYFRNYLQDFFEPVVIPRKWRFPKSIPLDTQGKKSRQFILSLFENEKNFIIHKVEQQENSVLATLSVPAASSYFDGHFPSFPLLPAVAQTTIIMELAHQYLGVSSLPLGIKKMKFTNMIFPDTLVKLSIKLSQDKSSLQVKMEAEDEDNCLFSQGTIRLGEA